MHFKTSAILLAGGSGTRMQTETPKQFLNLNSKPIALYSFEVFLTIPQITEIVVVCPPAHRHLFCDPKNSKPIVFASPGKRRQDSVYNGLVSTNPSHELVCVHDSARPFIDQKLVLRVLEAGSQHEAATVGMPIRFTVKSGNAQNFVINTPDRSQIWEIQTPQVVKRNILLEGFQHANNHNITVTDDVSLVELLGKPVKIVEGTYNNIKITIPADLVTASQLLQTN